MSLLMSIFYRPVTASLHALLQSGVQEASEEQGAGEILKPEEILSKIHPFLTGVLFQAHWVLPELIESTPLKNSTEIKKGLFQIGMGCQILDDMVDHFNGQSNEPSQLYHIMI
jgi:geranylgeranyl pyrophosphate synthase